MEAKKLVTLVDGRQVPYDSEEWRRECEAREVCRMPTKERRRRYIQRVGEVRGAEARKILEDDVRRVWDAQFRNRDTGREETA